MNKKTKQYIEDEKQRILHMSNADLLEEVIIMSGGDDYDGVFTKEGQILFQFAKDLLVERLGDWYK